MLYGFTLYQNPSGAVEIFASSAPGSENYAVKQEALASCGIQCNTDPFVISVADPFPNKLLIFLRFVSAII